MNEEEGLIEAYQIVDSYLSDLMFVSTHRIPYEQWPKELQGICGINKELLGPAKASDEAL